jgi:hypothetical protein
VARAARAGADAVPPDRDLRVIVDVDPQSTL